MVELPWAAECCPCVAKLRTVLPFTVGIRDVAVQLVQLVTHQRVDTCSGQRVRTCRGACAWGSQQGPGRTHSSLSCVPCAPLVLTGCMGFAWQPGPRGRVGGVRGAGRALPAGATGPLASLDHLGRRGCLRGL